MHVKYLGRVLTAIYVRKARKCPEVQLRLYLHLEATSEIVLKKGVAEINRLLNEETMKVGARGIGGGSHKYNVLG